MNEFKLLTEEQIFGDEPIEVIQKLGTECAITDFANALGASIYDKEIIAGDRNLKTRAGDWFTSSSHFYFGDVRVVNDEGICENRVCSSRDNGIRPVVSYSNLLDISLNPVIGKEGVLEIYYGEYPQYAATKELCEALEKKLVRKKLNKTGKKFTTDLGIENQCFIPKEYEEYEYNGKKYVRVIYKNTDTIGSKLLSNNQEYNVGDYVWIEISPIKWYVDEKEKLLISQTSLVSGIRFCEVGNYYGNFKNTEMYQYLNTYFAKEIIPNKRYEKHKEIDTKRKGIKIKNINIDKINVLISENESNNQKHEEEKNIKLLKSVKKTLTK